MLARTLGKQRSQPARSAVASNSFRRQHFLNFLPLPHGHASFRPTFPNGLIADEAAQAYQAGLADALRPFALLG
jgi:hypothetical protein